MDISKRVVKIGGIITCAVVAVAGLLTNNHPIAYTMAGALAGWLLGEKNNDREE